MGGKRGPQPSPEAFHLDAQFTGLRIGKARGAAPFALPEPGGDAADQDAANHEQQHQGIERECPCERGMRRIERIEGDDDALAIGHRQAEEQDRSGTRISAVANLRIMGLRDSCD